MPGRDTIHRWLLDENKKSFSHKYELACNIRTENMFDELIEIADTVEPTETNKGRLRVDTRKWYLSKVMPKKYGDKLDITTKGKKIKNSYEDLSDSELIKIIEGHKERTGDKNNGEETS